MVGRQETPARQSVGKNALVAEAKRHQQEQMLTAKVAGLKAGLKFADQDNSSQVRLDGAVAAYLEDVKLTHKPRSFAAYNTALAYFMESCPKLYLAEVDRRDLIKFSAFLRDEKTQAPRTVYNKFEHVMTFLKSQGIRGLVAKNDWPRYTEEEPEMYEPEELENLFSACDAKERLWYEFF